MAIATRERTRQRSQQRLNSVAPRLVLGHAVPPPSIPVHLFGQSHYTEEEQRRHPDRPMTRVIKDVLTIGVKSVTNPITKVRGPLQITSGLLREIAENIHLAQSRGFAFNLGKSHGNFETGLIPTDELIAPVSDVVSDGKTLWFACYVTPRQARWLSNPAIKVSPGLRWGWEDGDGNSYSVQMAHIATTDNPVIAGQGPFVAMANIDAPRKGKGKPMTRKAATADPTEFDTSDTGLEGAAVPMDERMRELWDRAFELLGLPPMPEDMNDSNAATVIGAMLSTLQPEGEGDEEGVEGQDQSMTMPAIDPAAASMPTASLSNVAGQVPAAKTPAGTTVAMSNIQGAPAAGAAPITPAAGAPAATPAATPTAADLSNPAGTDPAQTLVNLIGTLVAGQNELKQTVANLSNVVTTMQTERVDSAKSQYINKLNALAVANPAVVNAQLVATFTGMGESTGWNLSNLAGLEAIPVAGRVAKGMADPSAPAVAGVIPDLTPEQIKQGVDLLMGRSPAAK